MKTRIMCVDTETGGLDPARHALLSFSAVDSLDGEAFTALISPSSEWLVEKEALDVNGFTLEHLEKNGRPEREVMEDFVLWLGQRRYAVLAGCNTAFDRAFLLAAAERAGVSLPLGHRMICLQSAAWLAYEAGGLDLPLGKDGNPKLNLNTIAGALGMSRAGKIHNCLEDALLTLACLRRVPQTVEMAPQKEAL